MKKNSHVVEKDEIVVDDLTLFLFAQIGKMKKEELFTKKGTVRKGLREKLVKKYLSEKNLYH